MLPLQEIVVATDFNPASSTASDAAIELARALNANVTLVHVWDAPLSVYGAGAFGTMLDVVPELEKAATEALRAQVEACAAKGARVSGALRRGIAWSEVLAVAEERHAGLVVVGTHGRSGLPRALLGSVAEKIVRMSRAPVLVVHVGDGAAPA